MPRLVHGLPLASMPEGKRMETAKATVSHSLILSDRKLLELKGVNDVRSFDETEVMLETELGMLLVRGKNLQVKRLTLEQGELSLEGEIEGLIYSQKVGRKKSGESTLRRLFG